MEFKEITVAVGMLAFGIGAYSFSLLGRSFFEGYFRNPGGSSGIDRFFMLLMVFIETTMIFTLLIILILLFV